MNSALKSIMKNRLDESYSILRERCEYYECSIEEFINYLTGETFTGDTITLSDILENIYYVINEVVEIGFLKNQRSP